MYQVKRFKIKVRAIAVIVIVLGFTTYIIQVASLAYYLSKSAEMKNQTIDSPLSHFILFHMPHVFSYVPFSIPLGLIVEVSMIPLYFAWSYMELFVMMISIALVARFQQVNDRLDSIRGKVRRCQKSKMNSKIGLSAGCAGEGLVIDPR
jgi:gustatory receptor